MITDMARRMILVLEFSMATTQIIGRAKRKAMPIPLTFLSFLTYLLMYQARNTIITTFAIWIKD